MILNKFRVPIGIFLSLVFLYILVKYCVSYFALSSIKNLVDESAKDKIKLENISFEPFSMALKIENLNLDENESLKRLYVNFSFPNILQKKINISVLRMDGLKGDFIAKNGGFLAGFMGKNKSQDPWHVRVGQVEISNSTVTVNQEHKIEFKNVQIQNFDTARSDKLTQIKALILVNGSRILLDGNISKEVSFVDFTLNEFDLSIFNAFLDEKNVSFGKIKGELSSHGAFEIKDGVTKLNLNLELQNLFLYSKDLKSINYFAKELKAEKLSLENSADFFNLNSSSLEISNLLFSVPSKKFRKDKLSEFSKIKINNIDFDSDKQKFSTKGIINFDNGGFFALNKYKAGSKTILDIKADGIDLTKFSGSFEPLLNYQIESGKLSIDARTSLGAEKIKGKVKINLAQIKLDSENEFGQDIENQSLIPLKTAIFMIKDDDGNVELNFNLYGNKDDPNFDILGMLGQGAGSVAISKISTIIATKMAVKFTPMLLSSIPMSPGNVFMFTNGAYKMIVKPRFKDVNFVPLKSDIEKDSEANLVDLTQFLRKNKEVKFRICPVASTLEFDEEKGADMKILKLANERVESLKKYFKNRGEGGILNQIIFCRPKISNDSDVGKAVISL